MLDLAGEFISDRQIKGVPSPVVSTASTSETPRPTGSATDREEAGAPRRTASRLPSAVVEEDREGAVARVADHYVNPSHRR